MADRDLSRYRIMASYIIILVLSSCSVTLGRPGLFLNMFRNNDLKKKKKDSNRKQCTPLRCLCDAYLGTPYPSY